MIDGSPKVMLDTIYLHEHLVEVPLPLGDLPHIIGSLLTDLPGEVGAEAVDPEANAFMADVYAAFVEGVFDLPQ